jgi:hypothetical protein
LSEIRATAIFAHADLRRGRVRKAMEVSLAALDRAGRERFPTARAHEFFNVLLLAAQSDEEWHSARAAAEALAGAATAAEFRDLQFTNTATWAQMAIRCGDADEADTLYRRALDYYSSLAPIVGRAWIEIGFADASGDESRLIRVEDELENISDASIWVPYQRVRAQIALGKGRFEDARARLNRIALWMENPEKPEPAPSHRWRAEFRAAEQVQLELLARQARLGEALEAMERWRRMEDRTRTRILPAFANRDATPLVFAFAKVGSRLAAWRIDGSRTDFRWTPAELGGTVRMVHRWRRLLASPASSVGEIAAAGSYLQAALFGGWLAELPAGYPVLIQSEGTLCNLAFSALPGLRGHPIAVTSFAIPSAMAAASPVQRPERPQRLLLLDGSSVAPAWTPDLPLLPAARREIESIRALSSVRVEVIDGAVASPEQVSDALARASSVHFAGHSTATASGAALALTSEGTYDVSAFPSVMPPSVVLSACSTGYRAAEDQSDIGSPESLASAFLEKGSAEVIASLWDVDSGATEAFMRSYYHHLRLSGDSGSALQAAAEDLRHSSRFSHPYYWAAFTKFVRK